MGKVLGLLRTVVGWMSSTHGKNTIDQVNTLLTDEERMVNMAIIAAGELLKGVIPTTFDDKVIDITLKRFRWHKGMNAEELKLIALGIAGDLIEQTLGVSTTAARAAVQLKYADVK